MAGHRVGLEQPHAIRHVRPERAVRAERALPGVAAVEQQHLVAALGAHRFDGGRETIEPADAAVALRERGEILRGQRIGGRRAGRDVEMRQEVLAGDVRERAARLADAEVERRLAEIHRHELRVQVGEMQDRDVAERVEAEELVLRDALLREGAAPAVGRIAAAAAATCRNSGGRTSLVMPRESGDPETTLASECLVHGSW